MSRAEFIKLINHIYDQFMLPKSPAEVKAVATHYNISYLVAKDTDGDWNRKDSWVWTQPTVYTNDFVRVFDVKDLADR
jgi:hypothetical protein